MMDYLYSVPLSPSPEGRNHHHHTSIKDVNILILIYIWTARDRTNEREVQSNKYYSETDTVPSPILLSLTY